jgi:hypothetical protein
VPITTPGDTTHETKLAVADIGSAQSTGTAGYRTVRPVGWEDGGSNPASYPICQDRGRLRDRVDSDRLAVSVAVLPHWINRESFLATLAFPGANPNAFSLLGPTDPVS